jgi:hypothetical protein
MDINGWLTGEWNDIMWERYKKRWSLLKTGNKSSNMILWSTSLWSNMQKGEVSKCVQNFICAQFPHKSTVTEKATSSTDMAASFMHTILKESIKVWILCSLNLHFPLNTSLSYPPKLKQKIFPWIYVCFLPNSYDHILTLSIPRGRVLSH